MKKIMFFFCVLTGLSGVSLASDSDYLKVGGWQHCAIAMDQKIYKYFCLPPHKPDKCPQAAWDSLTKGQMLPECPLCPK